MFYDKFELSRTQAEATFQLAILCGIRTVRFTNDRVLLIKPISFFTDTMEHVCMKTNPYTDIRILHLMSGFDVRKETNERIAELEWNKTFGIRIITARSKDTL